MFFKKKSPLEIGVFDEIIRAIKRRAQKCPFEMRHNNFDWFVSYIWEEIQPDRLDKKDFEKYKNTIMFLTKGFLESERI